MRHRFVVLAVAVLIAASLAPASPAVAENPSDRGAKPAAPGAAISTGLLIADAAESAGAKLVLTQAAGGNSEVPPGRRCDPNDPRPGCQPLPKSPKK
jgi:uncharacterized membrane protein YdfJ with MMPL/SSD domain